MITEEQVVEALKNCYDPEIPINIVDLGLIYDIRINDGQVKVRMTLTARGCPMHSAITECALEHLKAIPGVKDAEVELVWEPPWSRDMISEEGKKALGLK